MTPHKNMPSVKFCGLSQLSDVDAMNELAPEYVGFVFWSKSKRAVDAKQARQLRKALDDGIRTVGVFVDEDAQTVASLYEDGIISVAQLHGTEDEDDIAELRSLADDSLEIWKAFEVVNAEDIAKANASGADLVLLDGGKGEGNVFPWRLLENMRRPFALAGGLNPHNVAKALAQCSPAVVDVSSGIEEGVPAGLSHRHDKTCHEDCSHSTSSQPHKDSQAMADFIRQVRG